MPKLPKKSTMIETISRVQGYLYKLMQSGTITPKYMEKVLTQLADLKKKIMGVGKKYQGV